MPPRAFVASPARRSMVKLLLGISGPSGSGKTFSALRLATGIKRVAGGKIFFVDTESGRGLHYASDFDFVHVPFSAPFSPLDYLAALEFCRDQGATTVIVDSMSHEHEGPGGVLEMHAAEVERMSAGDAAKAERVKLGAWAKPKAQRQRLINTLVQLGINVIFCFRAKDKLRLVPGAPPEKMGWMPIAGDEFVFEMGVNFLLPPAADGKPVWEKITPDQEVFFKAPPQHFRDLLRVPRSLDEQLGEDMAKWAAGGAAPVTTAKPGRASTDGVKALIKLLEDAGIGTGPLRQQWIEKKVGHKIASPAELTPEELTACNDAAKEGV